MHPNSALLLLLTFTLANSPLPGQAVLPNITTPKAALGFNIGDDFHMASYSQLETYWKKLATESSRMKLVDIGLTAEGRHQYMAIISSPDNLKKMAHYQEIARRLALAEGVSDTEARQLAHEGKAVVYIEGGLHAGETVGSQQLMDFVYQMLSNTDDETMRFLNDDIVLAVLANPDGQEIVANWYMREKEPSKRSLNGIPILWQKYVGHDNNRDSFMENMPETTNINRVLFREWHPQIFYDHHQAGPPGSVVFIPPFRDPFNYNLDPLIPLEIEQIGSALHARLVSENKGGSGMRTLANYSTWYNGAFRTNVYFHNMIGILSEIIGNPTPEILPLNLDKQLPSGDWPLPVAPQTWHYSQSMQYEMTNNRAMLDYASRNRENLLYYRYRMGMNSIERGSRDNWTITPKRIEAAKQAAQAEAGAVASVNVPGGGGARAQLVPAGIYDKVLHDPAYRDARGYIIPADQADFPTAIKFVNALIKNGVVAMKADRQFQVAGKTYPAGSIVVKTAQAFRPEVMDMFEPQDHPNDFKYAGGPPNPPYDLTGWTLAYQMGVQFDRVLDGFDGPFSKIADLATAPPGKIAGPANPAGYLISHRINDSFILINRLMKAKCDVYWLNQSATADGQDLGTGTIWVPASAAATALLDRSAKEFGITVHAVAKAPSGESAMKLQPIRIGLYDQYGGLMPSGWLRWMFEQYEFPYRIVGPKALDAGNLKSQFDVIVFTDGAFRRGTSGRGGGAQQQKMPDDIPAGYDPMIGSITDAKTIPQIKQFVDAGGSVITIGSSTSMASLLGVPVTDYLTEKGPDGKDRHLPQDKFYVPGALLKANIDNTNPLAYGMPSTMDVVFDSSPVFKIAPQGQAKTSPVAWFSGANVLDSGWAWNPQYLDGGTAVAEASVGEGKVMLFGPEVTFRGQPHGTFKLLFNGLYSGTATRTEVK